MTVTRSVLLTGTRAAATLDLARRLRRAGLRVIGADSMRFPLGRFSDSFAVHRRIPAPVPDRAAFADAVAGIAEREGVDMVWPTCEEVLHLAAAWKGPVPLFAPPIETLELLHDKLRFAAWARGLGAEVTAPESWAGEAVGQDLESSSLVWKPVHSRFAAHTRFTPPGGDRAGWMAQRFVGGDEFSAWALCLGGEIRVLTQYRALARVGRGAACALDPCWSDAAFRFAASAAAALDYTGVLAFDFIESADGSGTFVIECNPRMTSGIHILEPDVSLAGILDAAGPSLPSRPGQRRAQLALPTVFVSPRLALDASVPDVVSHEGDPRPAWTQGLGFAEFACRALAHRVSLLDATTLDIAYDGR